MDGATWLHYIYYHCSKRKDPECPEGSVTEKYFDEALGYYYGAHLEISADLRDWCINNLSELEDNEKEFQLNKNAGLLKTLAQKQKENDGLIMMKIKGSIDDADFSRIKRSIGEEIIQIEKSIAASGTAMTFDQAIKNFNLAVGIESIFRTGDFHEKFEALSELCSNLILEQKKLRIINKKLISIIIDGLSRAKAKNKMFEPKLTQADKDKTEVFASVCPTLLRDQDSNLEPSP